MSARYHITTPFGIVSPLVWAFVMERCELDVSQGIREACARCEVFAVGPDADAGAIPEDQRKAHENAFALFQAEIIFCALLVADVATVFLVGGS